MKPGWEQFLTERDKALLGATSWAKQKPFGLGVSPALVVVDGYYGALGVPKTEILESVKEWPSSCGLEGWEAIERTARVVSLAHQHDVPVFFTTSFGHGPSPWNRKGPAARRTAKDGPDPYAIVDELGVGKNDVIIEKSVPSAFQGTSLEVLLRALDRDTVLVCGEATSGCVRATAVDACCASFKVGLISDCCFDRFESSHWMSLFDLNQKYADLLSADEVESYLQSTKASEIDELDE